MLQPSKGGILAKACDYILELSESNQRLMNVLKDNERLVAEIAKQKKINERLFQENVDLKNVLEKNGLLNGYAFPFSVFHVFVLTYLTTGFLWLNLLLTCFMFLLWRTLLLVFYGLPYYFSTVCEPPVRGCTGTRACTVMRA